MKTNKCYVHIAKAIKMARLRAGLSQSQLAYALGYKNAQFISNVERGLCAFPVDQIYDASKVLGCDTEVIADAMINDLNATIRTHVRHHINKGLQGTTTSQASKYTGAII